MAKKEIKAAQNGSLESIPTEFEASWYRYSESCFWQLFNKTTDPALNWSYTETPLHL